MGRDAMIERELYIGKWHAVFLFSEGDYDEELVLTRLYDTDASYQVMMEANKLMKSCMYNCGFTYANPEIYEAVVVVGPTSSGAEFINTLTHEVHHLAVAIADDLGIDLEGETPAYLSGDSALALADVVCHLGCSKCNS